MDKTLKNSKYNPNKVYSSLIKETNLNKKDEKIVVLDVTRCIISISGNITHITAPMIREIVNTMLLKHGFEKERLLYTRIGFPYYDLKEIFDEEDKTWTNGKILEHIRFEYKNVKDLIKTINNKKSKNARGRLFLKKMAK